MAKQQLSQVLQTISDIIEEYESGAWVNAERLKELHRVLTSNMYYLTMLQIEYNREWNRIYHVSLHKTNAAKEKEADDKVPELYMCRKILDAAKGVSIAMGYELKMDN